MTAKPDGYFEASINRAAQGLTAADKAVMRAVSATVRRVISGSQVRWAGSQYKRIAVAGSDLDMCVESRDPVTEAQRRAVRTALEQDLARPTHILSHAVRLPQRGDIRKVDVAFANAAFGSRPLPDAAEFRDHRSRQLAARALKLWTRSNSIPSVSGWAAEALVVNMDHAPGSLSGLGLFLRVVEWLAERATPEAIEAVLRPAAFPRWNEDWSLKLPGRLEAVKNHSRSLLQKRPGCDDWRSPDDVDAWLTG